MSPLCARVTALLDEWTVIIAIELGGSASFVCGRRGHGWIDGVFTGVIGSVRALAGRLLSMAAVGKQ